MSQMSSILLAHICFYREHKEPDIAVILSYSRTEGSGILSVQAELICTSQKTAQIMLHQMADNILSSLLMNPHRLFILSTNPSFVEAATVCNIKQMRGEKN